MDFSSEHSYGKAQNIQAGGNWVCKSKGKENATVAFEGAALVTHLMLVKYATTP